VYGQFAHFPFQNDDHLRHALNSLYQCLQSPDLPVRVNAAVSLIKLLDHPIAVEFVRPGLQQVIKIYLKLIDEIDYDELITSLKKIVDVFEEEIGPYALDLCQKLGEAFLRIHEQRKVNEQNILDMDQDTSLTAEGLMTAIRRILQSISGRYAEMYPQLEEILETPIITTLNDFCTESTDEGLTCLVELIYNQQGVSQRMWNFFFEIVSSIMTDKGILDNHSDACFAFIINVINKEPQNFKTVSFPSG
jgi:importin-7